MAKEERQSKQDETTPDETTPHEPTLSVVFELDCGGVVARLRPDNLEMYANMTLAEVWEDVRKRFEEGMETNNPVLASVFSIPHDLGYTREGVSRNGGHKRKRFNTVEDVREKIEALCKFHGGLHISSEPALAEDGSLDAYEVQACFPTEEIARAAEREVIESWGMYGVTARPREILEWDMEGEEDG
jgi:hypothetical protein